MSKQPPDLTALSYSIDSVGKLFSDSKTRHTWTFDVEGETQVVVVTASWNSSKFVVEVNGYERFHQVVTGPFTYSFKFRERYFKISSKAENFICLIDTIPFDSYTAKSKAAQAALLKSYEGRSKPAVPMVPLVAAEFEPEEEAGEAFSGDLAKRLGKRPEEYMAQEDVDDEDFFAAPINVQSFVTPTAVASVPDVGQLTVIPDLLNLGDEPSIHLKPKLSSEFEVLQEQQPQPAAEAPEGPVTPRDQISPDNLVNPFSAFDELSAPPESASVVNPFV